MAKLGILMPGRRTIAIVIGTRPEAIKMAPVIAAFDRAPWARCRVILTGQHRELADSVLDFFEIKPDVDLDFMRLALPLAELAARLTVVLAETLVCEKPDLVLAQGDTTSVIATALACARTGVPFGHVEAGLRSHSLAAPYPEEANRVVTSHLAAIHFAPTATARRNLEREGIDPASIHITGNPVIDALLATARRNVPLPATFDSTRRMLLVTVHRRDSFGEPLKRICQAIQELHERFTDIEFLWPVHPNPRVKPAVERLLGPYPRVRLCEPLAYGAFVTAMKRAWMILSDSGGVQEEAPALGKPVLVLRDESERPEAIDLGVARLVGRDPSRIVEETSRLLLDMGAYHMTARGASPYGDGRAAPRIRRIVRDWLGASAGRHVEGALGPIRRVSSGVERFRSWP
jgi:UDP-N-acetylglucosamine 2-epimerase (non-hydrolysing)